MPHFKCLHCSAPLLLTPEQMTCPACGQTWPVKNGIPRFFQPAGYWGEIPQHEAVSLADEALQNGWREAVTNRFAGNRDMLISLLDWQRASWLALLALPKDTVALDIGSGYGAITHSLSHAAAKVYSLEAMSERIEFTRIRLEQEGIGNVQLLQGSALELPFQDEGFDLIVVNGVLEWVGEWRTDNNPRSVQRDFLRSLHRLLKPDGVLVIGIENRFSYDMIRGGIDHSGLPFTSLMPRRVASFYLRHSRRAHHRTSLNPKRQYRTYTYSERGYRKLLAESAFSADSYWAYPGYNEPSCLVPLDNGLVRDQFLSNISQPFLIMRGGWRQWLKRVAVSTGLLRLVVPDFLIFAVKAASGRATPGRHFWAGLDSALASVPTLSGARASLWSSNFASKSVIRVYRRGSEAPQLIVKTSTPARGSAQAIRDEHGKLSRVFDRIQGRRLCFSVQRPLGSFQAGNYWYAAESAAAGEPLARLLFLRRQHRRFAFLARELPRCADVAIELAQMLREDTTIEEVHAAWRRPPREWLSDSSIARLPGLQPGEELPADYAAWVQHGDFTIENIFLEPANGAFAVIDWQQPVRGVPPLYDVLSLIFSLLPAVPVENASTDPIQGQFLTAFFSNSSWAGLFRDVLLRVCAGLQVPQKSVWKMFWQSLVLRTHFHASRDLENRIPGGLTPRGAVKERMLINAQPVSAVVTGQTPIYARYLQLAAQCSERFILPPVAKGTVRPT